MPTIFLIIPGVTASIVLQPLGLTFSLHSVIVLGKIKLFSVSSMDPAVGVNQLLLEYFVKSNGGTFNGIAQVLRIEEARLRIISIVTHIHNAGIE